MSEVTYTIPIVGEKASAAVPKVNTALTEIKTTINGKIEAINIKNETVTGEKVNKEIPRFKSAKYEAQGEKGFGEALTPSATRPAFVAITAKMTKENTIVFEVESKEVHRITQKDVAEREYAVGFLVPAATSFVVTQSGTGGTIPHVNYLIL